MIHRICWVLCSIALVISSTLSVAQAAPPLQLGSATYSRAVAVPLRMPVTRSVSFFRNVGGVAFEAVAEGKDDLKVVALTYDVSRPDGQRLRVTVSSRGGRPQVVTANVYDWQLVPIARFANDENGSAMTLFGRLRDAAATDRVLEANGRVINYHPALDNTLVGLRLLQADILIIQDNAADLFSEGGRVILGAGESGHSLARNRERFRLIAEWQSQQTERFQSYVVGDLGQKVSFGVEDGRLTFTGMPHWAAWTSSSMDAALRTKGDALIASRNALVVEAQRLIAKYEAAGSMTEQQLAQAKMTLEGIKKRVDNLDEQIKAIKGQIEAVAVAQMPDYSRALSKRVRELDGINPIVYQTLEKVMHYRALFKHFQRLDPSGYNSFVRSLNSVSVLPKVQTPTVQH